MARSVRARLLCHLVRCDNCGRLLEQHIYLYGAADVGEKPGPLRLCLREACIGSPRGAKVRAVMSKGQGATNSV